MDGESPATVLPNTFIFGSTPLIIDFTSIKTQSICVWVPCGFLWLFVLLELRFIKTGQRRKIPWRCLNITKFSIIVVIIVLTVVNFIIGAKTKIELIRITTGIFKLLTLILAGIIFYVNKANGIRSSGILYLFWAALWALAIPQLVIEIKDFNSITSRNILGVYQFAYYITYFSFLSLKVILNSFVDQLAETCTTTPDKSNPEINSSFLSRVFYFWYDTLPWKGYRRPIEIQDIWDLKVQDSRKMLIPAFDYHLHRHDRQSTDELTRPKVSILPALFRAFGHQFLFAGLLRMFGIISIFCSPFILRMLLQYIKNGGPLWEGLVLTCLLFVISILTALINASQFHRTYNFGLRIRTALISAIFRKSMKLSSSARRYTTVGKIVNLMAVDTQKFYETFMNMHILWGGPLMITFVMYFLWNLLGIAAFAGLAVMVVLIPINMLIAKRLKKLQDTHMKVKDERIKVMNEILMGIKTLKLYAWEQSFEKVVTTIREKDMRLIRIKAFYQSIKYFIWSIAPFYVTFFSLMAYVLIDSNNELNAEIAFVSIAFFNILRFPMSAVPIVISNLLQIMVATKRINNFLNLEELSPKNVTHFTDENAVTVSRGKFIWDHTSEFVLDDINLTVSKGSLVIIVGSVGTGKSSMISAFLGEMTILNGNVNVDGSIAYVAQQAWIQNATLQANILFGKPLDEALYNNILGACALTYDLDTLPGRDQTEIGEKGINLSGGQKQRIALARAVYSDNDIYLLDDPLSAVDSHVGKHIFDHVIGPNGVLADKTRIFVTHSTSYLPFADQIVVMTGGSIAAIGTYGEFTNPNNSYSNDFIKFISILANENNELDEKKMEDPVPADAVKLTLGTSDEDVIKEEDHKITTQEQVMTGRVHTSLYWSYLRSIGIGMCSVITALMLLTQAASIASNIWLTAWINDRNSSVIAIRNEYLKVYSVLGVSQTVTLFASTILIAYGCWKACGNFHNHLLHTCLRLPMMFFNSTPIGRILNRFARDIDIIDEDIPFAIRVWLLSFFLVVSIFVVIIYSTPLFLIVILPIGGLYYLILVLHVRTSRQLMRLESVTRSPIYSHFSESITGQSTIRAFNAEERFVEESEKKVDFNQTIVYANIISNRWIGVRLETVGSFVILFAALFAVLSRDKISSALVGLSLSYALQITNMLNILVRTTTEIESKIVSVERVEEYAKLEKEDHWTKLTDNPLWPQTGAIKFQNYQLRYRANIAPVLHDINIEIMDKEKIGIVGRTGSGKSSLTLGLFRILEADEGEIIIDNETISCVGLHALRKKLTIIPQDPFLFSGTLRMNIDPFEMFSDDAIWKALELSHLKKFVANLPNGLWYYVSEGGENMSVGQRQLLCLARALMRDSKILLLDEATAAIDYETDSLIQATIRSEFKHCTVITIAHRLNTIMDCDRIIVLDCGRIVEFDAPEKLLSNNESIFYGMARSSGLV